MYERKRQWPSDVWISVQHPNSMPLSASMVRRIIEKGIASRFADFQGAGVKMILNSLPGGNYTSVQNDDGSWNILDVPIFAEHEIKLPNGKTFRFDEEWQKKAIVEAESLANDKYLSRVHLFHHVDDTLNSPWKPIGAGFLLPKRVAKIKYQGKEIAATYADILGVDQKTYEDIRKRKYPYLSVELKPDALDNPWYKSLSFLETEPPFFKFALFTIGTEIPNPNIVRRDRGQRLPNGAVPALAYRDDPEGFSILFKFDEDGMTKKKIEPDKDKKKTLIQSLLAKAGFNFAEDEDEDKDKNDTAKMEHKKAEESETPAWAKALLNYLMAIGQKMGVTMDNAEPSAMTDGPLELQKTGTAKGDDDKIVTMQELAGEIFSLKKERAAEKKSREVDGVVEKSLKALARYGLDDDETREELMAVAKDSGSVGVLHYVKGIMKHKSPEPPATYADFLNQGGRVPEELSKFQEEGPETLEKALRYSDEYEAVCRAFPGYSVPKDKFIRIQMENEKRVAVSEVKKTIRFSDEN